jgi:hypothetical protein
MTGFEDERDDRSAGFSPQQVVGGVIEVKADRPGLLAGLPGRRLTTGKL